MGVAVLELQRDRAGRRRPAAPDLVLCELEPVRQHDADAVLGAGHGVADRLAAAAGKAHGFACRRPLVLVDVDADLRIDRIEDGLAHGGIDGEERRHLLRLLAGHDAEQTAPLRLVRPLVDDRLHLAVPLVDRAGPGAGEGHVQPIELGAAEMPAVDAEEADRLAEAVGRQGIELARAGIAAIAVAELHGVDFPVDHRTLPVGSGSSPPFAYTPNASALTMFAICSYTDYGSVACGASLLDIVNPSKMPPERAAPTIVESLPGSNAKCMRLFCTIRGRKRFGCRPGEGRDP